MEPNQIAGILSNWNAVEANIRSGLHEDFGKSKDIQDVLDIIHDLQETVNTVSPLREMFNEHLTDLKNPHEVQINLADLDLINILYQLYMMKFGMDMSLSEFGYSLVNIKRFATRADIDAGINPDSIVNIDIMDYIIEKHNVSPDAHSELFRHKFPGTPLVSPPTDVFETNSFINNLFLVERACPMNVYDINGRVRVIPEHTIGIDYSYGVPAAPVFGPHRNIVLNSNALNDVSILGGVRSAGSDLFIITPNNDQQFLLFQETVSYGEHGYNYNFTEELTGINNYYVHVYPLARSVISLAVVAGSEIIATGIFDCKSIETQLSSISDKVKLTIQDLPSGFVRCCITFDASEFDVTGIQCRIKNTINPDNVFDTPYQGIICNAMGLWQHQSTQTALPTPPIFTENTPITVLGTKIRRDFSSYFNPIRGSFVIRYLSPMSELFDTQSAILRLGDNDPVSSVVRVASNPINKKRNRITSYNINNDILEQIDSEAYDPEDPTFTKRVVFTYTLGYHGYGFTDYAPEIYATSVDSVVNQVDTFFSSIFDASAPNTGAWILQIPQDIISDNDNDDNLVVGELANNAQYRLNMEGSILELGYDSISDQYLEGYLLNFRYYSLFSSRMNIEFLLDQYIPE